LPPFELWAWAFVGTILLEVPLVAALTWPVWGPRGVLVGLGLQVLTHPALWYLCPRFTPYWLWLVLAESLVTAAEAGALAGALAYAGQPWPAALRRALAVAVVANVWSTLIGLWWV
jgi:hypothetical protein